MWRHDAPVLDDPAYEDMLSWPQQMIGVQQAWDLLKVANLPLIPGILPPAELNRVPVKKVVGLTISPIKLGQIRKERELGTGPNSVGRRLISRSSTALH